MYVEAFVTSRRRKEPQLKDLIRITDDWPAWSGSEGFRLNMELQGATYRELQELADWLESHSWFDEATAIREHHFEA